MIRNRHIHGRSSGTSPYVTICGSQLCLSGQPFRLHGATTYGQLGNATNEVALAKSAGLNTLEIVEYEIDYHVLASQWAEATWTRIDNFISVAGQNGLRIILNLSSFGQSLMAAGTKPTTYDWGPFLDFVVNRINTVSGVRYCVDPTIAIILLYGEIDAPNYSVPLRGTTQETTDFYSRTLGQLRALDPYHLIATGGFSYINDPNCGIDWQTITSGPNNDLGCAEINSLGDRNVSVPNMSTYCQSIGKPWFLAAWSSCYQDSWGAEDINDWQTDAQMAAHAQDMYNIARNNNPTAPGPAMASIGCCFWNLAAAAATKPTCSLGTQWPLSFAVVQNNAP